MAEKKEEGVTLSKKDLDVLLNRIQVAEERAERAEKTAESARSHAPVFKAMRNKDSRFDELYRRRMVEDGTKEDERPFTEGDIVKLKPGAKLSRITTYLEKQAQKSPENEEITSLLSSIKKGEGPLGEVIKYKNVTKKKDMKYLVEFPGYGLGKDGVVASELELVERPIVR